jgi:hypothetical protein
MWLNRSVNSLTPYNILVEADKIVRKESGEPTLKDKITQKLKFVVDSIKYDTSLSKIEKLEALNELRKDGGLTEEEFNTLKREIIG